MQIHLNSDVQGFIDSLESATIAKVLRTIDLLEKFGHMLSEPHSKKISGNLFELRVRGRQEIRIFYCFHNRDAYLLSCFRKQSQKTPLREIAKARQRMGRLTEYNL